MKKQMLRFAMAGVAGYIVDSVVLYAVMAAGMGFLRGRLLSFTCAVVATWLLNRRYTFSQQLQPTSPAPLWLEFGRYLIAMSLGGFLNLAMYWLVLAVMPEHPAIPALGVAVGSLTGMVVNFASAKWWVFIQRESVVPMLPPALVLTTPMCLLLAQLVFWLGHLHDMALPGLYMDAVNPDYLAARTLHPALNNPVWAMPTVLIPVLGNLYHGVQNYYVGLPVFALLGFNMLALRVAQGLFGSGILVLVHLLLQRATGSLGLALAGSLGLATEIAFIASFRTQMYIVMAGAFWLLLAVYLAFGSSAVKTSAAQSAGLAPGRTGFIADGRMRWFLSGVCAGLAVYSYFVFVFFVPVFVIAGGWRSRNWRVVWIWLLGFVLAMQTYVFGYLLAIAGMGGLAPALEWLSSATQNLAPMSAEQTLGERLRYAWLMVWITLENGGNDSMIFGATDPTGWAVWKMRLLVIAPLVLIASGMMKSRDQQHPGIDGRGGMLAYWHVAWLPITFLAVSLIFGARLWAHHFSSLVPLAYLIFMLAVHHISKYTTLSPPRWIAAGVVLCVVLGNLQQQSRFFDRLESTGGVGRFSNAINRMADDALSLPAELVHVFPEWGLMLPFAFLTGNERIYEIDMSPTNLSRLAQEERTLRLYYWKAEDADVYRASLLAQGYEIGSSGSYNQRNQEIAFHWMEAVMTGKNQVPARDRVP